jgi:hypothetical protein
VRVEVPSVSLAANASAGVIAKIPVPLGSIVVVEAEIWSDDGTDKGFTKVLAVAKNVAGTVSLTGTPVVDAFVVDAEHVVTAAANDTSKTVDVIGDADATNITRFFGRVFVTTV